MPTKDPDEILDYSVDWDRTSPDGINPGAAGTGRLADGETILASEWEVELKTGDASPLELAATPASKTDTTTTIWLRHGSVPNRYEVTNHITTSQGRALDKSFNIQIREK